jgi:hypothetical protein
MEEGLYLIASATQECPTSTMEKVVWTVVDRLHDRAPVQVDRTFCEWYVHGTTSGQFHDPVSHTETYSSQFFTSSSCMVGMELI